MKRHFRCSEPTLQKSSEANPALNRGTFLKTWREDKDVFTDHSGAKRISDKARVKERRLFYHAWHTFTVMFLASPVENVSSFPLQRCEMLTTSWAVCALYPGRQQMSGKKKKKERELKRQHGAITQTLHPPLYVINRFYTRKRNIPRRLSLFNMPPVLMREPADWKRYCEWGRTVHSLIRLRVLAVCVDLTAVKAEAVTPPNCPSDPFEGPPPRSCHPRRAGRGDAAGEKGKVWVPRRFEMKPSNT